MSAVPGHFQRADEPGAARRRGSDSAPESVPRRQAAEGQYPEGGIRHESHPPDTVASADQTRPVTENDRREDPPEPAESRRDPARDEPTAEEYLDLLKRARADFANFRRRVEEERTHQAQEATAGLIARLLPILDDFERAIANEPADLSESEWAKGVQLIERNLRAVLSGAGVERIEAEGAEFNPWEHEAIAHQPSDQHAEGRVLHVVRPGYRRGDRVIRPAQVVVSHKPDAS